MLPWNKKVSKTASSRKGKFLLKNSLFQLRSLHDVKSSKSATFRNNAGFTTSDTATAAHLPSYLYWLFHRGGIPFEEARQLCAAKRLLLNGSPIADEKFLETQIPWRELATQDFKVVNDKGVPCDPIQRARHRTYAFMRLTRTLTFAPDEADPRSFIHSLPFVDPPSISSYRPITPAGFLNTMRGLLIVSNDAHLQRLWHNEFLGNMGRYDLRFHAGAPDEVVEEVRARCARSIAEKKYSKDLRIKPQVVLDRRVPNRGNDDVARMSITPSRPDVRLILDTPLLEFPLWSYVRRHTASCTLTQNGPFSVPLQTLAAGPRRLNSEELEELFAFERVLKTNKIVYGLRALQDDAVVGADGADPIATMGQTLDAAYATPTTGDEEEFEDESNSDL